MEAVDDNNDFTEMLDAFSVHLKESRSVWLALPVKNYHGSTYKEKNVIKTGYPRKRIAIWKNN